ncbi:MAG: DUF58 domain-containing protein [Dehalococcoidia bacterium]|nr:DUF58 domain-containing protein [Dehalococcoidia bacterium]
MKLPFRRRPPTDPRWERLQKRRASAAAPGGIPPELLDRVRAIEIKARRLVNSLFLGEYHAVFRGRGIEFDELRPYVPGDDVRSLDWKAYARTGQPSIRRYREDRDLTVLFVVDVSASQRAGALPQSKADLAAEVCAVLALAAIRNKDKVGLLLFASKPERYVRPSGGATHVLRVVREMLWARPETTGTDIGAALEYLTGVQKRRATVFLVSDFLAGVDPRQLRAAARRHDIIALRARESIDERLPDAGIITLRDSETGQPIEIDTGSRAVRDAYAHRVAELDDERKRLFGAIGIDEVPLMVGVDYVPALLQFFRRRTVGVA